MVNAASCVLSWQTGRAATTVTEPDAETTRYACVVGHEIAARDLEQQTEMHLLDQRLEIRLCRRHGAPIAVTRLPKRDGAPGE